MMRLLELSIKRKNIAITQEHCKIKEWNLIQDTAASVNKRHRNRIYSEGCYAVISL